MTKTVEYQGYKFESVPHRLDGDKWRLHIYISVEDSRGVLTRQFAVDSIYATGQEADIHGIAYGQRLIDGKVDGQSVMDMKTTDRRATPRLRVQFRTTFSVASSVEAWASCLISRRAAAASRARSQWRPECHWNCGLCTRH
jgi:hypothetical protein